VIPAFDEVGRSPRSSPARASTAGRSWSWTTARATGRPSPPGGGAAGAPGPPARGKGARSGRPRRRRAPARPTRDTLDGERPARPAGHPRLLAAARLAPSALVVGRRPPSAIAAARGRVGTRAGSRVLHRLGHGVPVRDTQSGFAPIRWSCSTKTRPGARLRPRDGAPVAGPRADDRSGGRARRRAAPVRPSRFHPLADACHRPYLALQVGRRGARELGDAPARSCASSSARAATRVTRRWPRPGAGTRARPPLRRSHRRRGGPAGPEAPAGWWRHPGPGR